MGELWFECKAFSLYIAAFASDISSHLPLAMHLLPPWDFTSGSMREALSQVLKLEAKSLQHQRGPRQREELGALGVSV